MPAPLNNQYAKGHGKGAPQRYTAAWIERESQSFLEWMRLPDSIFFKTFAIERGYHPNRLQEFADKSEVFSGVLEIAKAWQESKLVNYGLFNKTNSGMTKFVLSNHHGYTEKSQIAGNGSSPLAFLLGKIDGASKDLINGEHE